MASFHIHYGKTPASFKISTWNQVHIFIGKCSCAYISIFEESKKALNVFGDYLCSLSKFQKTKSKIRHSILVALLNPHVLLKISVFFPKTELWRWCPCALIFDRNRQRMTSFTPDVWEPLKNPAVWMCERNHGRDNQSLVDAYAT